MLSAGVRVQDGEAPEDCQGVPHRVRGRGDEAGGERVPHGEEKADGQGGRVLHRVRRLPRQLLPVNAHSRSHTADDCLLPGQHIWGRPTT